MAIRLKDIARELGVSVITVSKALRGEPDISDATRERILKRMKELAMLLNRRRAERGSIDFDLPEPIIE